MLRILIVKTTSMGDVIHALPVLEDIHAQYPEAIIDWLVEAPFLELVKANKHVNEVIPIELRKWRQKGWKYTYQMWCQLRAKLADRTYDYVIDLQGLIKSALLSCAAQGQRLGPGFWFARESLASLFYQKCAGWDEQAHAVERLRQLTATLLGHPIVGPPVFYDKHMRRQDNEQGLSKREIWFLHGTARIEKKWPVKNWCALAQQFSDLNYTIVVPWGSDQEKQQADKIATEVSSVTVLPRLSLGELAEKMKQARLVVGLDSGLTHLAAAFYLPMVALFLATPKWRFAPRFNPRAISLGDQGSEPSVAEVFEASNRVLRGYKL